MFINAQYHRVMKDLRIYQLVLLVSVSVFLISSCSTSSSLPEDDVYYSATKSGSRTAPNGSTLSNEVYESSSSTGDYQSYYKGETSTESQVAVGAGAYGSDYETTDENYSEDDIYYDSDYESRIKRFNNEDSDMGYYDDYYTGGDGCGCSGGSNWSMSFGIGMGYGWGMGYGYGWPYYGYPYYGYPYYGYGGGYWGGYNNGYWNGYWDGYYGYPYGGGYYPEYGYGYTSYYGPRGGGSGGGTNVPRTGSRGTSGSVNPTYDDKTIVAGSGGTLSSRSDGALVAGGTIGSSNQNQGKSRPAESVRVKPETLSSKSVVDNSTAQRIEKPRSQGQVQGQRAKTETYRKPEQSNRAKTSQKPPYEKPQSYRKLPSQQARSSKEYVAPKRSTTSTTAKSTSTNTRTNTRRTVNAPNSNYNRSTTNSRSNVKSISSPTRQTNTRTTTSTTRKTTPSKSKSSTSKRSYSSPSKSYSSPSRSYSSPSRSSSSGSSSRSSGGGSSSRSSGGGGRR